MPSFLQNLRMAGIFGDGRNPFLPRRRELPQVEGIINPPPPEMPPMAGNLATIAQQFWKKPGSEPNVVLGSMVNPWQAAQLEQKEADRASREKIAGEREATSRAGQEISQLRANVYKFKAENPNAKIVDVGGKMQAIHPITGAVIADLGDSRWMNEKDKLELLGGQKLTQIDATGEQARSTEGLRAKNREELERLRAEERRRLKGVPQTTETTPNEVKTTQFMRAQEAYNTHPEWRKYIKLGEGGSFAITADPSRGITAASEAESKKIFDDINAFIYGMGGVTEPAKKDETKPELGDVEVVRGPDGKLMIKPKANK